MAHEVPGRPILLAGTVRLGAGILVHVAVFLLV